MNSREAGRRLEAVDRRLEMIYTALVVRDPGTHLSADAYEGLRKQVIASATDRLRHVAQLAEFDLALARGADADDLRALVSQWLSQAGVARVDDPELRDAFEPFHLDGSSAEVDLPGYVDTNTGRVVKQGRLRRVSTQDAAATEPAVTSPTKEAVADPAVPVSAEDGAEIKES
ncbi:hypothetical protein Q6350_03600 [Isoptericola sp. b515]|uniref:hypothetical protein n=1 Tax=Isoptericola sp. b515 TaxID=3064652 RepID=UPI00271405A5|nr:hypothetical protein [Isoptericola sp. b515]MDO8147508.1 hypothetical protein [Isoptericola sp. b515]